MAWVRYAVTGHVAEITMDSPPVNALSVRMIEELLDALRRAAADDDVRAVILASALPGRFCAGLDLSILTGEQGLSVRRFLERLYVDLADVQYGLGKPSIAAIDGAARAGGMTLAIQSNVILAGERATFGYPEIDVGLVPAIHFIHLPRVVGRHRAFEILFSGRAFDAHEARELGLVSRVVPEGRALDEARALARDFASKPPTVMKLGHAAFMRFNDQDYRRDIASVVETFCTIAATDESREGIRAFVEKRPPGWRAAPAPGDAP